MSLRLLILAVGLLPVVSAFAATQGAEINAKEAMAIAEQFVKDNGYLDRTKSLPTDRQVLFLVTIKPVPKIKGNETAWGMLVDMDQYGHNVHKAHGVAVAYDGKSFARYTKRKAAK